MMTVIHENDSDWLRKNTALVTDFAVNTVTRIAESHNIDEMAMTP